MQNLKIKMDANMKIINEMNKAFERWRLIDDYDNYSVSSFGRVRNDDSGKVLKAGINSSGYYAVSLCNNGKKKNVYIHRLVTHAFIDNHNNKGYVDHIDNNKLNNKIPNLRWVTSKENNQNRSISKRNTSGIKGVSYNKRDKKWHANIRIDGILIYLGGFHNIEDAKKVRFESANQSFGIYINTCEK
jgi:hypothetical protein